LSLDFDPELNEGQDFGDEPNPKWPNINPLQEALRSTAVERARAVFGDFLEDFLSLLFDCDQSLLQHQHPAMFEFLSWRLLCAINDPLGLPVFKVSKPPPGAMVNDDASQLFCSLQQLVASLPDYRLFELASIVKQRKVQLRNNSSANPHPLITFKSFKRILKPISLLSTLSASATSSSSSSSSDKVSLDLSLDLSLLISLLI